jgi:hypothetical protein
MPPGFCAVAGPGMTATARQNEAAAEIQNRLDLFIPDLPTRGRIVGGGPRPGVKPHRMQPVIRSACKPNGALVFSRRF